MLDRTRTPNSRWKVIGTEWVRAWRAIFHVSHCVGCEENEERGEKQNIHPSPHVSATVYFYRSTQRFKTQRPHRSRLNPSITDDIIKLLNEIKVPVDQRLFSRTGLHNQITLQASARTGGRPLSQNRAAHKGWLEPLRADFTLYTSV